jgi:hypothetical protein
LCIQPAKGRLDEMDFRDALSGVEIGHLFDKIRRFVAGASILD